MAFEKITTSDYANKGVTGLADTPGLSTTAMQEKFDELSKDVIIPKFNTLVDALNGTEVANSAQVVDSVDGTTKSLQAALNNDVAHADSINAATNTVIENHKADTSNPHNVTAAQTGAYTTEEVDSAITAAKESDNAYTDLVDAARATTTDTLLAGKVDKVDGKGLSTNDYTDAEKATVAVFSDITDVQIDLVDSETEVPSGHAVVQALSSKGYGDMLKSTYDTNSNGIVDNAERLGGQLPAYYATATALTSETTARENADSEINDSISHLTPSVMTEEEFNKLTDDELVNGKDYIISDGEGGFDDIYTSESAISSAGSAGTLLDSDLCGAKAAYDLHNSIVSVSDELTEIKSVTTVSLDVGSNGVATSTIPSSKVLLNAWANSGYSVLPFPLSGVWKFYVVAPNSSNVITLATNVTVNISYVLAN